MKKHSELHDALASGDQDRVIALLHDGANIEAHNSFGWTPLMATSMNGQVDLARLLLEHGADLNAVNSEGKSAIHYAAMRGGAEAVRLLVRHGADVNAVDAFGGYTPLHLAAHCDREIVQDTCTALLAAGADINARNKWGSTALWSAVVAMRGSLVDFLIQHGAEVNIRDYSGKTVLMFVTKFGFGDACIITQLLTRGAEVNAQDAEGRTALMYAAISTQRSIMSTLLDGEADIDLQDVRGTTALMYAAGEAPALPAVVWRRRKANIGDMGADAVTRISEKKAARLAKAYHERAEAVRYLLMRGANPTLRDTEGRTALDIATQNGNTVQGDNAEVVAALMA